MNMSTYHSNTNLKKNPGEISNERTPTIMLTLLPSTSPTKVVQLFDNEKFISSIRRESDPIYASPKERLDLDAEEIIRFWQASGLRKPRVHREEEVYDEARKQFKDIMLGKHHHVPRLSKDKLIQCVVHFKNAATCPGFRPQNKKILTRLSILEFIFCEWTTISQLLEHIEPPQTLEKEIDPTFTKEIIFQYHIAKYGTLDESPATKIVDLPVFARVANRVLKYLKQVEKNLQPAMGLGPKNPQRAAYALMKANKVDRTGFVPIWLASDNSIANLERWLKDQGFFKPASHHNIMM